MTLSLHIEVEPMLGESSDMLPKEKEPAPNLRVCEMIIVAHSSIINNHL